MAQKTEKEETEFKVVPETITPCINNCGVTGNPATNNMCQKCLSSTSSSSSASASAAVSGVANSMSREKSPRSSSRRSSLALRPSDLKKEDDRTVVKEEKEENLVAVMKREVNRCTCCRKKVGLTGFRCRCGEMFCAEHRYSDRHDCSYDYKSAGREAIARENPVVKAAKIIKI